MEVLYHGIKTRYVYDFPFCLPHELLMSLRSYNLKGQCHDSRMRQFHVFTQLHASYTQAMRQSHCQNNLWKTYGKHMQMYGKTTYGKYSMQMQEFLQHKTQVCR